MATSQQSYNKAVIATTPASIGNQEVLFDPKQFNDFIYKHGYEAYIERRLYCPCINTNTGQPLADCLNCGGTGKFFINKQATVITCTGMSNMNKYVPWSITNMGIASISTMPKDKMGFEDRVTLPELEMWFSEVLQLRKSNDGTKIFAFTKYFPNTLFYAYYFAGPSNPLVYIEPNLMTVVNNTIVFDFATFNPLFPVNVTVCYVTNPQYYIIDINRDLTKTIAGTCNLLTDTGNKQNLPLHYVGRLVHIIQDQPNLAGIGLYDNTNYAATPPNFDI
jgi:hypothetical protein